MLETLGRTRAMLAGSILDFGQLLTKTLGQDCKIMVAGNGGSTAQARHFAAEITGRYKIDHRVALPAIALNTDKVLLTARANDIGFDQVFFRQVQAFGQPGDVLLLISTSGISKDPIEACKAAQRREIPCLAMLGKDGGELAGLVDRAIVIPSANTARIQEVHLLVLHLLCELIEMDLFAYPATHHRRMERIGKTLAKTIDLILPVETARADGVMRYSNSKKNGKIN